MGLDVYLYTKAEAAANEAHNEASNAFYERPDYDKLSDDEKAEIRTTIPPYESQKDVASERYPDHLFNRRYLRSSYNGGGFNHAVPQMLGHSGDVSYPHERGSIYWIFEPMGREWDGDDGNLTAADVDALRASKARALEVADGLRKADRLRVVTISPNFLMAPPEHDDDAALRLYRTHIAGRDIKPDDWYSTRDLEVFGDGLKVLAAIPGKATFNVPGVHLIYRQPDEGYDSYIQSAELVAEFCDEAIALIERDGSCSMSWSG